MASGSKFINVMGTDINAIKTKAKQAEAQVLSIIRKVDISAKEFVQTLKGNEAIYKRLVLHNLNTFRGDIVAWKAEFEKLLARKPS